MDAVELYLPDGKPARVWMCPACGTLVNRTYQPIGNGMGHTYTPEERDEFAKRSASRCCEEARCPCGAGLGHKNSKGGWTKCDACRRAAEQDRERECFEKAKKLTAAEWDGPVFTASDRYFSSLDDFEDHYADSEPDDLTKPEYVWCSKPCRWEPDASGYVLDGVHGNLHEDAADMIDTGALAELDKFVNEWSKANIPKCYEPDYSRCVVFLSADVNA